MNTATDSGANSSAIGGAIEDIQRLIAEHELASRRTAYGMLAAFLVLVLAATTMYLREATLATQTIAEFERVASLAQTVAKKTKGDIDSESMSVDDFLTKFRSQLLAVVNRQQALGTQNQPLLLVGAGVFSLVFGLLMAVYRHHLTEISKLQHYKTAFTRIRVAQDGADSTPMAGIVQAALVDRAFDYRSGKEKQIESPAPGHPVSDASTILVNKLLEELAASRKS